MKKRVLYLLLVLSILLFGCAQQQGVIIKDLVIGELEGSEHAASFFVTNQGQEPNDCQAKITMNNDLYDIYDLGIIKPNEKAFFETAMDFENGPTPLNIITDCKPATQKEIDTCGSEKSVKRRLCMLTLDKPQLRQCITNDITYYNFFCIALISKNPEVCNYIGANKRIWCKAYVMNNADLCATIKDENDRNWCYTDIGMNFQDESICKKITDEKSKISCIAAATKKPELCLKGAERYKLSCILNIIEATSNKELCSLLDEQKEECLKQIK